LSNKAPTYQQQPYGLNNTMLFKGNMVRFSLIKKIEFVGLRSYVAESSEQTNFMFFASCVVIKLYNINQ